MLTPLPSATAPNPLPAGPHALPLPHGADPHRGLSLPLADLPDLQTTAPTPQPRPGQSAEMPLPGAPTEQAAPDRSATLLARATALSAEALATAAAAPQGSTATPMSLVAAQMQVDPTALQAVLAQQAATRALPGAHRRPDPHSDDPPAPLLAAPDDSFDPHAPHPPPVPPSAHGARPPPGHDIPETAAAAPDHKGTADRDPAPVFRLDMPVKAPFPDLPGRPTLWTLAGAVFLGIIVLALLLT